MSAEISALSLEQVFSEVPRELLGRAETVSSACPDRAGKDFGLDIDEIRQRWSDNNAQFSVLVQQDRLGPKFSSPAHFSVDEVILLTKNLVVHEGDSLQLKIDPYTLYLNLTEYYSVLSRLAPQNVSPNSDISAVSLSRLSRFYQERAQRYSEKGK